jgi:ABC-type Na+ efflux pump permease subunit
MWIWFVLVCAIVNIFLGMIMKTEDLKSFFVFKAIPFFSGLGALIYFLIEKSLIG